MKKTGVFLVCFLLIFGLVYAQEIDLIEKADQARWRNTDNQSLVFGRQGMEAGTVMYESNVVLENGETYKRVLFTHPQWQSNGLIQGLYSNITVPKNDPVLVISGGFKQGARGTDGVNFSAIILEPKARAAVKEQPKIRLADLSPSVRADCGFQAAYDDKIDRKECSLSDFAGETVGIILQVSAGPASDNDWAVWTEAKIVSGKPKPPLEAKQKKLLKDLRGHTSRIYDLSFSPDGKKLASASADATVRIWNIPGGNLDKIIRGHKGHVFSVDFSRNGNRIVTAGRDGSARVWRVGSGQTVRVFGEHADEVLGAAFSPDGSRVASVGNDGTVRIWQAASGNQIQMIQPGEKGLYAVDYHPNGNLIAVGGANGVLGLWNVSTGNRAHQLTGHSRAIQKVEFSGNGSRMVSSSADNTVRVWNSGNGNLIQTISGMPVNSGAISSDGFFVISGNNGRGFIWKAGNGNKIMPLDHVSGSDILAVAFSPNGRFVALGGDDGVVRLWRVELEQ